MKEKISIIIPVYNTEAFLYSCVDSVLAQTYTNIEILLVNDGSVDGSLAICREYQQQDKRVHVIDKPFNSGLSDTRNTGISQATGEYIVFVDSDDTIEPDMVEKMYQCIIEQNTDVVRCNYFFDSPMYKDGDLYSLAGKTFRGKEITAILPHLITTRKNIPCYSCLLMIRKDKIIPFDAELRFMEDTYYFVELLLSIDSIAFLDKKLYHYKYNASSLSKNLDKAINNVVATLKVYDRIKQLLASKDLFNDELDCQMDACQFSLMVSKLKLLSVLGFGEFRDALKSLMADEGVAHMLRNAALSGIPKKNLPEYFLLRCRLYFLAVACIKLKIKLKGQKYAR